MEQHPIPQDVTGFQFKLIGTMTVKQFGYVAAGAILAVICWYAPGPNIFWNILKFSLMPVFGISGVIIAFVPIEGRPVDVMATNFFHALFSPNQYIFIKRGRKFSFTQITYAKPQEKPAAQKSLSMADMRIESKKEKQLRALLSHSYADAKSGLDQKEAAFLMSVTAAPQSDIIPLPPIQQNSVLKINYDPQSNNHHKTISPSPGSQPPIAPPATPKSQIAPQPAVRPVSANDSHQKILDLQKQISDTHMQKDIAEQELLKLKKQMSVSGQTVTPSVTPPPQPEKNIIRVRSISPSMSRAAGFSHISDTPNIIVGIVKDSRENILPNILVEIKDKDGNPTRAFKTNPLGQFASATPLSDGVYDIVLEDPKKQHVFDVVRITANGKIMLPIEIISRDAREELRKSLFVN